MAEGEDVLQAWFEQVPEEVVFDALVAVACACGQDVWEGWSERSSGTHRLGEVWAQLTFLREEGAAFLMDDVDEARRRFERWFGDAGGWNERGRPQERFGSWVSFGEGAVCGWLLEVMTNMGVEVDVHFEEDYGSGFREWRRARGMSEAMDAECVAEARLRWIWAVEDLMYTEVVTWSAVDEALEAFGSSWAWWSFAGAGSSEDAVRASVRGRVVEVVLGVTASREENV